MFKVAVLVVALVLACPGLAFAAAMAGDDALGREGNLALAAENMMAASFVTVAGENSSSEQTYFSILLHDQPVTPYGIPRIGLDYFQSDHFTLGGALGYASSSPDGGSRRHTFFVHPRAGFLLPISTGIDLWLRAGFSYYDTGSDEVNRSGLAVDLSGMLTLNVAGNFALALGPQADIGLLGDLEIEGVGSSAARITSVGINAGLLGWLP